MASDVKVHMKSVQKADDMADINQTETDGRLTVSSDRRFILRFDTTDDNGVTSTTVKTTDGSLITVVRSGVTNAKMEFDTDAPTPFLYKTPIGVLEFMLKTDEISLIMDEAPSLSLTMKYRLYSGGACVSKNSIDIACS